MFNIGKFVTRILDVYDPISWRTINKTWRDTIDALVSRIRTLSFTYSVCQELLVYDKAIYDEHWYRRDMVHRKLSRDWNQYWQLRLPVVSICDIVLDDEILPQYIVDWFRMPDEYYVLLMILHEFPSPCVEMLDIEILRDLIHTQSKMLETLILTMQDDTALDNVVLFVPICRVIRDIGDVFICYVNVVDTLLENDFPMDQERFYVTDSLENLVSIQNGIREGIETRFIPRNIASELTTFAKILIRSYS
jgi:hypothetical protein